MKYGFVNPLDQSLMTFDTLDRACESALSYVGKEGAFAEHVVYVEIFEIKLSARVGQSPRQEVESLAAGLVAEFQHHPGYEGFDGLEKDA